MLLILTSILFLQPSAPAAEAPFELRDGDRVVLLGGTLIERDQSYGHLETALTARWPGRSITFRNLGWSGDTVFGHARAGFGTTTEGFQHLKEQVAASRPTVLLVAYGAVESFDGAEGLPRFVEGLNTLLDAVATTKARVVLLAPNPHEDLGPPLPNPASHNRDLALYRDAIRDVANHRGYRLIDLFDALRNHPDAPLTNNGIHLTDRGARAFADAVLRGLGLEPSKWSVSVDATRKDVTAQGATVRDLEAVADRVRFRVLDDTLPGPAASRTLRIAGLAPGHYTLTIDGQPVADADAGAWARGVTLTQGPEFETLKRLRTAIGRKNTLFFYRWRPQNETYLFGFRKHEQGQNAAEVPRFDPLVAEQEKAVEGLRKPVEHAYELKKGINRR
ncbi:MAG TPA: GDSL-type esterase/lipase family protein [Isosphaeraceae bacterium]|jgi:lysophospholipase L1-like esterase|nr:GDSL-type esterase/lipase family protein [Isosphaeraceae bacterium]